MTKFTIVFLFVMLISACASIPVDIPVAVVDFKDGPVDHFSSRTNTFTRDMCPQTEDVSVPVKLPTAELQRIAAIADSSGFFKLPEHIDAFGVARDNARGIITVIGPCAEFSLEIASGSIAHKVEWRCATDGSENDPVEVAKLVSYIRHLLYTKRQVKELLSSSCRFH